MGEVFFRWKTWQDSVMNNWEIYRLSLRVPCSMYSGHQTRTQCHVPAHVIFLAQCSTACLVSVSHMHDMCMWLKGLTAQVTMECCSQNICLRTWRSMAHVTPSQMISLSLSTTSLLTCTPIRPSTRPRDLCRFHLLRRFTTATIQ